MPPTGIEPVSQAPEACTLSVKLRGLRLWRAVVRCQLKTDPPRAETVRTNEQTIKYK